jgi:CHAT domain-containing protein
MSQLDGQTESKFQLKYREKINPYDTLEMDYQFPSQQVLDQLLSENPKALAQLELKTICYAPHTWKFLMNDGTCSKISNSW